MNKKTNRFKKIGLMVALVCIGIATRYVHPNNKNRTTQVALSSNIITQFPVTTQVALNSSIADQLSVTTDCLPNNGCNDKINNNIAVPEQEKTLIWNKLALKRDIHQCKIVFNEESVQQINQILEEWNDEVEINETTYRISKYLTLKIISGELPDNFKENLGQKIQVLLYLYKKWFGLYLHKKLEVNLVILPSLESYKDFIEELDIKSPYSQGLFWAKNNYAFVAFRNEKQLNRTSLHEVIHSLNFSFVGIQSRWLNEGLAQSYKMHGYSTKNSDSNVNLNINKSSNNIDPLDYSILINSEEQWGEGGDEEREQLYLSSRLFVDYLLTSENGIKIVKDLLKEESENPCSKLSDDTYLQRVNENEYNLQTSFDEWLEEAKLNNE